MYGSKMSELDGQGKQHNSDRPELSSAQILLAMKKKPYTQLIHGVEYTYSILSKKQQTFVLTNQRFLVLKGIDSISYARSFPQNRTLPFANAAQIPEFKFSFRVAEIESFTNEQQRLIIQFSGKSKVKWQFVCPTKVCALEWRKKLDKATLTLAEFQNSRYNKLEDFLQNKKKEEELKFSQFNELKSLTSSMANNTSQPSLYNASQSGVRFNDNQSTSSQLSGSVIQAIKQPLVNQQIPFVSPISANQVKPIISLNEAEKPLEPIPVKPITAVTKNDQNLLKLLSVTSNEPVKNTLKGQDSISNDKQKDLKPFINYIETNLKDEEKKKDRPIVLFQGSQMAQVQNFILQNRIEESQIEHSMMSIPIDEKQNMKAEISKLRRNWIEQLLGGQEEGQLIIDFKRYVKKIAKIIINELYVPQQHKMYPVNVSSNLFASYLLEDIQIQIYFYSQEHLVNKNPKYKAAVTQFKNFDYLLGALRNQGILKIPFMMLFEFKGFLGMAKSRIGQNKQLKNRQLYEAIDRKQFEKATRISSSVLLNQEKCKIVVFQKRASFSKMVVQDKKIYFIDNLSEFLPYDIQKPHLLRPEFIQDEELEDDIFRDETCQIKKERIDGLILRKINYLVKVLESGEDYFTNSNEFSEIIHFYGLNIHHIGAIYKAVKQKWLKKILQAEMAARCAKNFFRLDVQNSVLANADKINKKQRQEERQRNRVISFLNIVFGSTETTFRIWRSFSNSALQYYDTKIWENDFNDINVNYFLQAIQNNFKIVLGQSIHEKKLFKSMNTFQPSDFVRFEFDSTIYNLEFTDVFEEIHQCLQEDSLDSFHDLCQILVGETSTLVPYVQLLKNHPIHDKISEFLLNFTSPEQNPELYKRIESRDFPSRFTFESKLAEIKWQLKSGNHEAIYKPASFIQEHAKKWLGNMHPIFTQLNHTLAEYFAQYPTLYSRALKYSQNALQMQQLLYQGDCQPLWKDYFLIGKINYHNGKQDEALKYLLKGKELVRVQNLPDMQVYGELNLILARCYITIREFKLAYSITKDLYTIIRQQRDEKSLTYILQSVTLIKQLLQFNQEHESYYKFMETDFSKIIGGFTDYPNLIHAAIKLIVIPFLKKTILSHNKNGSKILLIVDKISKIPQNYNSCLTYLKKKIVQGLFPYVFINCLKEIDLVIDEIEKNEMLDRWISFNKLANQSLLQKISASQIYRGFEFLANLTALFHLLGEEAHRELFLMEK